MLERHSLETILPGAMRSAVAVMTATLLFGVAPVLLSVPSEAIAAELAVGDPAPEFALRGSDGKEHRLSEYKGKQALVLAWFPKAFTPG